jgi:hypothetical protein
MVIELTETERQLLCDALDAFLEGTPITPDPDAPAALTLKDRLQAAEAGSTEG